MEPPPPYSSDAQPSIVYTLHPPIGQGAAPSPSTCYIQNTVETPGQPSIYVHNSSTIQAGPYFQQPRANRCFIVGLLLFLIILPVALFFIIGGAMGLFSKH